MSAIITVGASDSEAAQLLDGLHLAAMSAMGSNSGSPLLSGVRIRGEGGILTVIGTDSCTLVEATIELGYIMSDFDILVPSRELKKAVAALRKTRSGTIMFEVEPRRVVIANQIIPTQNIGIGAGELQYPSYENLFKGLENYGDGTTSMTAASLPLPALKLATEFAKASSAPVMFITHPTDLCKPVKVLTSFPHIRCLVMSVRF